MNKKSTQPTFRLIRIGVISIICSVVLIIGSQVANAGATKEVQEIQTGADVIVKGTVKDRSGALPGVTVTLKGSEKIGISTDVNGNFSLRVPENGTLIFKAIGFETVEIAVNGRSTVNVVMQEGISNLSEVVVVGYTTKSLSQLSSSVSVVSGDKLRDVTSNNLTSMLQGKAPGVIVSSTSGSPNAEPSIIVRGSSSITAGAAPLYVVDGIIGGTANPNDVESVTILKDAAATGLYGSRAANGVIIITTKTGKAGSNQVNFNASTGINRATMGNSM